MEDTQADYVPSDNESDLDGLILPWDHHAENWLNSVVVLGRLEGPPYNFDALEGAVARVTRVDNETWLNVCFEANLRRNQGISPAFGSFEVRRRNLRQLSGLPLNDNFVHTTGFERYAIRRQETCLKVQLLSTDKDKNKDRQLFQLSELAAQQSVTLENLRADFHEGAPISNLSAQRPGEITELLERTAALNLPFVEDGLPRGAALDDELAPARLRLTITR